MTVSDGVVKVNGSQVVSHDCDEFAAFHAVELVNAFPAGVVVVNDAGVLIFVNEDMERMAGYPRGTLLGQPLEMLLPERYRTHHISHREGYAAAPTRRTMGVGLELTARRHDNTEFPIEVGLRPMKTATGTVTVACVIDISERKRMESTFSAFVDAAPYGMLLTNASGEITMANRNLCSIFGYEKAELIGQPMEKLVPARRGLDHVANRDQFFAEQSHRCMGIGRDVSGLRKDGREVPVEVGLTSVFTNHGQMTLAAVVDITVRKGAEKALAQSRSDLEYASLHDGLTGLPNRVLLFDRMEQAILSSARGGQPFSLLMMDLNQFKEINDNLGHDSGDEVLKQVAKRLLSAVRKSDTVSRIGGDEFACLLPTIRSEEIARKLAEKIITAVEQPLLVEETPVRVGISIGIAQFPGHGQEARTLMKHADQAMYVAKQGLRGIVGYSSSWGDSASQSVLLTDKLQRAVANGELRVHFQPQVDLHSRRVVGKEALVRWQHPEEGMVPPGKFIPAAEKSSAIAAITFAVLEMTLDQEKLWRKQGFCIPVSVNLSPRLLDDEELPTQIAQMLSDRCLPPESLILELTETALFSCPIQARSSLDKLSAAGIRMSIDDFGAGYTSFKQLRELEISEIKIDGMYVSEITAGGRDASIVRALVELGRGFNIQVIAECVESENSWRLLQDIGCKIAQGYSVGRPMPAEDFDQWRTEWSALSH